MLQLLVLLLFLPMFGDKEGLKFEHHSIGDSGYEAQEGEEEDDDELEDDEDTEEQIKCLVNCDC